MSLNESMPANNTVMAERHETQDDATEAFPRRVLVLFAHPALEKSRVNRRLVEAPLDVPGVTFHDLYQAYPDFHIRVEREQELLEAHDVVVFQHPMFWYSTPAILKEWQDLVLTHGWAYGSQGTALHGKWWLHAITAGGREAAYRPDGFNEHTISELLVPLRQTARLCGMEFPPPFVLYGTHGITRDGIEEHVGRYRHLLEALRDDRVSLDEVREHGWQSLEQREQREQKKQREEDDDAR